MEPGLRFRLRNVRRIYRKLCTSKLMCIDSAKYLRLSAFGYLVRAPRAPRPTRTLDPRNEESADPCLPLAHQPRIRSKPCSQPLAVTGSQSAGQSCLFHSQISGQGLMPAWPSSLRPARPSVALTRVSIHAAADLKAPASTRRVGLALRTMSEDGPILPP